MKETYQKLQEAIISADSNQIESLLSEIDTTIDYEEIYTQSISPALDSLCASIKNGKGAIPELLMGLKQVENITSRVKSKSASTKETRILMGVVEGDIHDMGKNVIRDVCRGYGYQVIDLGKNVSPAAFADAAKKEQPDLACLSTMMSTTIDAMQNSINELKTVQPEIKVLIGGAFMNRELEKKLAAHGYAEDASVIKDEIERVLQ